MLRPMPRVARTSLKAMTVKWLAEQGGLCPLCGHPIDLRIPKEGVVDHNHDTGEVRGVLHRSCNAAEGKAANAIGHWGSKSMAYPDIIAFAERLVAYWKSPGKGMMYPTHKTPEEKKAKRAQDARTQRAARKARAAVQSMPRMPV